MLEIYTEELFFFNSAKESVISFLGDIGKDSDGGYRISKGWKKIEITLEKLLLFTKKHEVQVEFLNGSIYIR